MTPEMQTATHLWSTASTRLRGELGKDVFKAWIEPLRVTGVDSRSITLAAPNTYAVSRLQVDYLHRLQARWSSLDSVGRRIKLVVQQAYDDSAEDTTPPVPQSEPNIENNDINPHPVALNAPKRTFDNFEVGDANRVAVAIAKRVAEDPDSGGVVYLHGIHGVGKTHLLEAIANHLRETAPRRTVLNITAQRFLNEFQTALRERDTVPFKAAVRSAEVLLIDDLQLICGKSATQDEFFQTLGDMISRGRTVVCTADVPVEALQGLSARMRCILQGGFSSRICEPDLGLRRAIAMRKVAELAKKSANFNLPAEALDMVAAHVVGTGRAIEGKINQVFAASALVGKEVDMEVVVEALSDHWKPPEKTIPVEMIKKRVAAFYDLSIEDLCSQRRHRTVARPRQIAMYFCKKLTRRSFPDIGQRFGKRDHTTVMHAVKRVEELILIDPSFASEINQIGHKIIE